MKNVPKILFIAQFLIGGKKSFFCAVAKVAKATEKHTKHMLPARGRMPGGRQKFVCLQRVTFN